MGESAERTGTLHSAARLIERHIVAAAPAARPQKRARDLASAAASGGEREVRVLLMEIYRQLADEDVVRGAAAASTPALAEGGASPAVALPL